MVFLNKLIDYYNLILYFPFNNHPSLAEQEVVTNSIFTLPQG